MTQVYSDVGYKLHVIPTYNPAHVYIYVHMGLYTPLFLMWNPKVCTL